MGLGQGDTVHVNRGLIPTGRGILTACGGRWDATRARNTWPELLGWCTQRSSGAGEICFGTTPMARKPGIVAADSPIRGAKPRPARGGRTGYEDKGKAATAASVMAGDDLAALGPYRAGARLGFGFWDRRRALPMVISAALRRDPRHAGCLPGGGRDVVAPPSAPEARPITSERLSMSVAAAGNPAPLGRVLRCPHPQKRRTAGDNPDLSASPGLSLMAFGRGPLSRRASSSGGTRARSRRSSSMRARIAGKSSAARGRGDWGSIVGKLGKQGEDDRLDNYG